MSPTNNSSGDLNIQLLRILHKAKQFLKFLHPKQEKTPKITNIQWPCSQGFHSWVLNRSWYLVIDRCLLGICSRLLYILFAAFPSLVYGPSVCHSLLVKVEQTITSNPIENPAYSVEYNNYFPWVKVDDHLHYYDYILLQSFWEGQLPPF